MRNAAFFGVLAFAEAPIAMLLIGVLGLYVGVVVAPLAAPFLLARSAWIIAHAKRKREQIKLGVLWLVGGLVCLLCYWV